MLKYFSKKERFYFNIYLENVLATDAVFKFKKVKTTKL